MDQSQEAKRWPGLSLFALVGANLVPLYGVLAWEWEVFPLLLLFWLENLAIGAFNVLKMAFVSPGHPVTWVGKLFFIPFFCFHYGMFTMVHGVFVIGFFGGQFYRGAPPPSLETVSQAVSRYHLEWAVVGLVLSHAVSFVSNYLMGGEFRNASLMQLMQQPYGRVVVLHLAILGGGFLMMLLGSPAAGLLLLLGLKITLDVRAHLREHRKPIPVGEGQAMPAVTSG